MVRVGFGALFFSNAKCEPSAERDEMASTALPKGHRVRYSHAPACADLRSGSDFVRQAKSGPAASVDHSAGAHGTGDHRQAEYFVRLLTESRRLIDHRVAKYQRAIALAEADGDVENARALRGVMCVEEKDRQVLSEMIENLERRFRPSAAGAVTQISRRALPAVR
jgi:hypothetical protein